MLIEKAAGGFIVRFLGTERKTFICHGARGMIETVIGYFVPRQDQYRWRVEVDDPPVQGVQKIGDVHE